MTAANAIRSLFIRIALGIYNAGVIAVLNFLLWRNHIWNPKRWAEGPHGDRK